MEIWLKKGPLLAAHPSKVQLTSMHYPPEIMYTLYFSSCFLLLKLLHLFADIRLKATEATLQNMGK